MRKTKLLLAIGLTMWCGVAAPANMSDAHELQPVDNEHATVAATHQILKQHLLRFFEPLQKESSYGVRVVGYLRVIARICSDAKMPEVERLFWANIAREVVVDLLNEESKVSLQSLRHDAPRYMDSEGRGTAERATGEISIATFAVRMLTSASLETDEGVQQLGKEVTKALKRVLPDMLTMGAVTAAAQGGYDPVAYSEKLEAVLRVQMGELRPHVHCKNYRAQKEHFLTASLIVGLVATLVAGIAAKMNGHI